MRLYFGLIIAALGFAAVSGAAMAWDGSYVLFKILDLQSPFLPHDRLVNIPLHGLVLLVNRFTNDLNILQTVFGLAYASIPLVALALSWWVVRDHAEPLFIWVALGIGFGTLPGQLCFACEALFAILLFWPVFLAILVRIPKRHILVIFLLAIAIFLTHPIAMILFAISAFCSFIMAFYFHDGRIWMLMWGIGFSVMSMLKLVTFLAFTSPYEVSLLSTDVLKFHFAVSVLGIPLMAVISTWFAASMIFISSFRGIFNNFKYISIINLSSLISIVAAGSLLAIWARDASLWRYAISFRLWALPSSLPFMIFAVLEAIRNRKSMLYMKNYEWNHRLIVIKIIGLCFLIILLIQSTAWFNLTTILHESIDKSEANCLSISSMDWLTHTPLHNWTTPSYAILLQGRAPRKLVLEGDGCMEASFSEAVRLAPWDLRSRSGGWFDLHFSGLPPTRE